MRTLIFFGLAALCPSLALAQTNLNDLFAEPEEPPAAETAPAAETPTATAAGDTATRFQAVARQYESAVALVLAYGADGRGFSGTAWAFEPGRLVTNGHISQPIEQFLAEGGSAFVLPNKTRGEYFRVTRAVTHPRFGDDRPNPYGAKPQGSPYDLGILEIDGAFGSTMRLAETADLYALDSGTPLAFLGFPREDLSGGNVSQLNPIATMQTGIVTSISDFYLEDRGPQANQLIRHSLPATGGASGSPIFTADGLVVGALNGGNIDFDTILLPDGSLQRDRQPSAALINFGQRIDLLSDIIER